VDGKDGVYVRKRKGLCLWEEEGEDIEEACAFLRFKAEDGSDGSRWMERMVSVFGGKGVKVPEERSTCACF